ncbi:thioredoxin [bacterium]|nr:thioredoxin [bacterium]
MAIQVSSQAFAEEVEKSDKPVVADFYADWCGPCKMITPIMEEILQERSDLKIVKINVDEAQDLAQRFGVMSIPTISLFKDGKVIANWVGLRPKPVLLKEIDEALAK